MRDQAVSDLPLLALDVDGVISLFGWDGPPESSPCTFHLIDGMAHCIADDAGAHLERLAEHYQLAWATGWEDRANEHLLHLLGVEELPVIRFGKYAKFGSAHWKLDPIGEYARGRALAWVDDNIDDECKAWARERPAPTILVRTNPARGLESRHVERLIEWATNGPWTAGVDS